MERKKATVFRGKDLKKRKSYPRAKKHSRVMSNREYAQLYLERHPCVDCGETDPVVLDFDHVRGVKRYTIANRSWKRGNFESFVDEIKKCDIRCSNCHRRRHHKERLEKCKKLA